MSGLKGVLLKMTCLTYYTNERPNNAFTSDYVYNDIRGF